MCHPIALYASTGSPSKRVGRPIFSDSISAIPPMYNTLEHAVAVHASLHCNSDEKREDCLMLPPIAKQDDVPHYTQKERLMVWNRITVGQRKISTVSHLRKQLLKNTVWKTVAETLSFREVSLLGYIFWKKKLPPATLSGVYHDGTERLRLLQRLATVVDIFELIHLLKTTKNLPRPSVDIKYFEDMLSTTSSCVKFKENTVEKFLQHCANFMHAEKKSNSTARNKTVKSRKGKPDYASFLQKNFNKKLLKSIFDPMEKQQIRRTSCVTPADTNALRRLL